MPLEYHKKKILGIETLVVPGESDGHAIVLFHGFGATSLDLLPLSQVIRENPKPTWFFPEGPLDIPFGENYVGKAWFPIEMEVLRKALYEKEPSDIENAFPKDIVSIRKLGLEFLTELQIPFRKIFVGGFSQGAVLATDLALHHFENLAGILIFSGTLIHEENWGKLCALHKGLPFFQSHGEQDQLLPIERAEALEKLLVRGGLKGEFHRFRGGHEIPSSIIIKLNHFLRAKIGHP